MLQFGNFLISFPLLIPSAFTENVAIKDLPEHLYNGAKCWVGINTITNTTTAMASLGLMYYTAQQISTSVSLQRLQQQVNEGKVLTDDEIIVTDDIVLQSTTDIQQQEVNMQDAYHYPYVNMASPLADSFLKKDFLLQDNKKTNKLQAEKKKPDDCGKAPIFVNAYMCANIFYNILIIMLIKYGSAVLFYISMSILLPLSSFAFAMPFMPKPTKLSAFDIIGLIVLLVGLSIYRFYHQIFGKKKTTADEEEALLADGENGNTGMIPSDNNATLAFQQQQQQQQQGQQGGSSNTYMKEMMNANLDDPFGDGADDYAPAEYHPTLRTK
eukprot:UN01773